MTDGHTTHRNSDAADRVTNSQLRAIKKHFRALHAFGETVTRAEAGREWDVTDSEWMTLVDSGCLKKIERDGNNVHTWMVPEAVAARAERMWANRHTDGCPSCGAPGFETIRAGEILRCKSCNERCTPEEWRGDS